VYIYMYICVYVCVFCIDVKFKAVPVVNQVPRHEVIWRSGRIAPQILVLGVDGGGRVNG
jgi:hypothetical protein